MVRSEPISFERKTLVSDGYNGSVPGNPTTVFKTLAIIEPLKPSRLLEANQETMRQGYRMLIWATKDFEPAVDDTVIFRDERLTLTGYRYEDMRRLKYVLTVMEQVASGG